MTGLYWVLLLSTVIVPPLFILLPQLYYQAEAFLSSVLTPPGPQYDYIVVGAGSAGSVVAGRLARAGLQVLLVEAGGPAPPLAHIPAMVGALQRTVLDWAFTTELQARAAISTGRVSRWPRGKVLGGSSILNYMIYMRGHSRDYDHWREAGLEGWGYQEVLKYFKKSQHMELEVPDKDHYHGSGGELTVTRDNFKEPIVDVFMRAAEELGYKVGDINGELEDEGFSPSQVTLKNGFRTGTYKAFAERESGKNLTVLTFAHASRLLFDGSKAVGVEVTRFGRTLQFFARQEVVVSAGSIGSPQLVMLSGIGDSRHLEEVGVRPLHHLPEVGRNLQDHLLVPVSFDTTAPLSIQLADTNKLSSWLQYLSSGRGPLTSTGGLGGVAQLQTEANTDPRPDIQFNLLALTGATDYGLVLNQNLGMRDPVTLAWMAPHEGKYSSCFGVTLNRPKSRGYLELRTNNPLDHPIIQPNYLSAQEDVDTLIAGIRIAVKLLNTTAMLEVGAQSWQVK